MVVRTPLLLFFLLAAGSVLAQPADTASTLPLVTVEDDRLETSAVGRNQDPFDSLSLQLLGSRSVGDLLNFESGAQVRSNGPGQSVTAGYRGSTASQTAVLWNGLNIQNPTLGQTDLSLVPAVFLDDVRLEYGGGTTLWGSGAVGGSLHLGSRERFGTGWDLGARLNYGSFRQGQAALRIGHHGGRLSSRNTFFFQGGRNDFPFDSSGTELRRTHAETRQWGGLSENRFRLGSRGLLGVSLWYQGADRNVPGSIAFPSRGFQQDQIWRAMTTYRHTADRLVWNVRLAGFFDRVQFELPAFGIASDNRGSQLIGEVEGTYYFSDHHQLRAGLNNTWLRGRSDSYPDDAGQNRTALFAAYTLQSEGGAYKVVLSGRQELVDGDLVPFVPSLGLEGRVLPGLLLSATVSRNYRLPALDDLFFRDAFSQANPELLAESGWNVGGGVRLESGAEALSWTVFARGYSQWVDNLIVWFADSNFIFSPENIAGVHNRGLETGFRLGWQKGPWQAKLDGRYDYVRSTITEAGPESGLVAGTDRLMPRHRVSGSVMGAYRGTSLAYWHSYSDVVDLGGPFSVPLRPYHLANLTLSQSIGDKDWAWSGKLYFTVFNLWDAAYQQVSGYPQPGRHFEGGIILDILRKARHALD